MELIWCVRNRGTVEQIRDLLALGCPVNYRDELWRTALHYCYTYGEGGRMVKNGITIIRLLILHGADVNVKDSVNFRNPLMHYMFNGCHPDLLISLLDNYTDVNAQDIFGNVALFYYLHNYSSLDMNTDLFKRLIPIENINGTNCDGETPLMVSIRKGCDKECIRALLYWGADLIIRNNERNFDESILHIYLEGYQNIGSNSLEVLKLLVNSGADVNFLDGEGYTPLWLFLRRGIQCIRHIRTLLDNGADVQVVDLQGNGLLHHRLMSCSMKLCRLFLDCGLDPSMSNLDGDTPLTNAVGYCMLKEADFLAILRDYGATINLDCLTFMREPITGQTKPLTFWMAVILYVYNKYDSYDRKFETILKHVFLTVPTILNFHLKFAVRETNEKLVVFGESLYNELEKMKKFRCPSGQTLYDFIIEPDPKLYVWYFHNSGRVYRDVLTFEFPQFASILWSKIEFARRWSDTRQRLDLLIISSRPSRVCEKKITLNMYCVRHLAGFLTKYDVQKLIMSSINI